MLAVCIVSFSVVGAAGPVGLLRFGAYDQAHSDGREGLDQRSL
jgi:hypothetical protein